MLKMDTVTYFDLRKVDLRTLESQARQFASAPKPNSIG